MIKYELSCSSCGYTYPVYVADPSSAPVCKVCKVRLDASPVEVEY